MRRARLLVLLSALALGLPVFASPTVAASPVPIQFTRVTLDGDQLTIASGALTSSWQSPPIEPGFGFTRLVASWNADTPADSHVAVDAQVSTVRGETSDWYSLGTWAADDHAFARTSRTGQVDAIGQVDTDTLSARGAAFANYTLRVRLNRASSDDPSPTVRMLGAEASAFKYPAALATSAPIGGDAVELPVAPLSQEVHARQYPQWGGGGEAWCSPTSTEMVVEYWGRAPTPDDLAWVDPGYADPGVDFAARSTYDAAYRGTGNWPFNTAYAARFALDAFVTQLRSLAEAEQFVRAGIPLVASIAANPGELNGFLFPGGTKGHLVVIVGFDATGRPIVNDPAAWTNAGVRRVYDRAQFERVWQRGSNGTVYVIHPTDVPLPPPPSDATASW